MPLYVLKIILHTIQSVIRSAICKEMYEKWFNSIADVNRMQDQSIW